MKSCEKVIIVLQNTEQGSSREENNINATGKTS